MKTNTNIPEHAGRLRRVATCLVAGLAFASAASAQVKLPGPTDAAPITDDPVIDTGNPAPGGGAGPGKIEHGTRRQTGPKQLRFTECPGDMDQDGFVDIGDMFAFFELFDAGDARADLAPDREFGVDDLLLFLIAFDEGC